MTSTYTAIADGAIGDQFTADLFTALADNDDHLKNPPSDLYAPATSDSNYTTTSTTFVAVTNYSLSVTTQGGKLLVGFFVRANSTNARFDIWLDGVSVTGDNDGFGAITPASTFGMQGRLLILNVSAGVHTLVLYARVTTGTLTIYPAGLSQFFAWEIGDIS